MEACRPIQKFGHAAIADVPEASALICCQADTVAG
jgi:hypothetical protein